MKHIKTFESFINKSQFDDYPHINESNPKYVTIVWDDQRKSDPLPDVLAILTSSSEDYWSEMGKGELADVLQNELKRKIDTDDFEVSSTMTYAEYVEEYQDRRNPNRLKDIGYYTRIDENVNIGDLYKYDEDEQIDKIDFMIYNSSNKSKIIKWEKKLREILRNLGKFPKLDGNNTDPDRIRDAIKSLSIAHKRDVIEWGVDILS